MGLIGPFQGRFPEAQHEPAGDGEEEKRVVGDTFSTSLV
jgi:hypothetical protein